MVELVIDSIRVNVLSFQRVVILRVKESDRYLPIWIGASEADSIALKLQDVDVPRPMTHDLMIEAICAIGAEISHVVISDLNDDTFYAKILIRHQNVSREIDARPSDALALAVRMEIPIYAEKSVIEQAAVEMELDSDTPLVAERPGTQNNAVGEDELKKLSAYTEFVDTLNLEDIGKHNHPPTGSSESDIQTT
ncbi:MAG: bifunctional nuclease family protein [Chloroflexota bacterium]|nr:bifunctional nuclease family protein [Chloroflexota bacterium]